MPEVCERCGERLVPGTEIWLEYDRKANSYREEGTVALEDSQGSFPFGRACAKHPNTPYRQEQDAQG